MNMTREEEIKQAAYRQYCNSESICFTLMCDSFKQGAKWADCHPINVWHDASEEPLRDKIFIIELDANKYGFKTFSLAENNINSNWSEVMKELPLLRWAYIDDLLPKE